MGKGLDLILCFFFFLIVFVFFRILARKNGWLSENFSGRLIPTGYGIVLCFFLLFYEGLNYAQLSNMEHGLFFFTSLLVIVGWLDDRYGNSEIKGIKGHLFYFLGTGKISTGLLKAIAGLGAGVSMAFLLARNPLQWVIYSMILALSANYINLLDVRPGRALKGFGILFLVLYGCSSVSQHPSMYGIILIAFLFAALPYDLKGKMMLGDAGANGLGFSLGCFVILTLPFYEVVIYFLYLVFIHWYAEKSSISLFIRQHPILRRVDEWGS